MQHLQNKNACCCVPRKRIQWSCYQQGRMNSSSLDDFKLIAPYSNMTEITNEVSWDLSQVEKKPEFIYQNAGQSVVNAGGAWRGHQQQWWASFQIIKEVVLQLKNFISLLLSSEPRDNTSLKTEKGTPGMFPSYNWLISRHPICFWLKVLFRACWESWLIYVFQEFSGFCPFVNMT